MDAIKVIQSYVEQFVGAAPSGMKVLLLDTFTTTVLSLVFPQSWLLSKEVYLVDLVSNHNRRTKMHHLKCICYLRPTSDSVRELASELRDPHFGDYFIYFSNILRKSELEILAESDVREVVREVHEFYGDFLALNGNLFSLGVQTIYDSAMDRWVESALERSVQGLAALCAGLRRFPVIRYEKISAMAKRLAQQLHYTLLQESNLFRRDWAPVTLFIADRRSDCVTPLLTPWTYQSMVHEILGIQNGLVNLANVPDIKSDMREVVIGPDNDQFFAHNMYESFGELGATVKNTVAEFQSKTNSSMTIESIADMKKFVESYPEFRKLSSMVSKHVTVIGELSRRVEVDKLLETGELEQNLACKSDSQSNDIRSLRALLSRSDIPNQQKLKLCMLYALRYENSSGLSASQLAGLLSASGVPDHDIRLIADLIDYGGREHRPDDLFTLESFISRGKSIMKGLKGVENVYMQHTPHINETVGRLLRGKLSLEGYPFVEKAMNVTGRDKESVSDAVIFVIGGATYAEAASLHSLTSTTGASILLGSTSVLNSSLFLDQLRQLSRDS